VCPGIDAAGMGHERYKHPVLNCFIVDHNQSNHVEKKANTVICNLIFLITITTINNYK